MLEFLTDNLVWIIPVGVAILDGVLGKIPDKAVPYIGILRRIWEAYREQTKHETR
jgi:hypothetical protein